MKAEDMTPAENKAYVAANEKLEQRKRDQAEYLKADSESDAEPEFRSGRMIMGRPISSKGLK